MGHKVFITGESPLVAAAIHSGHQIRPALLPFFKINAWQRLREEDPGTDQLTLFSDNRIVVLSSRFEFDVNRPREKAIYQRPEDAWGLPVSEIPLSKQLLSESLWLYDQFYQKAAHYFQDLLERHPWVIIFDIHSYNHQREAYQVYADPRENPEINIGTGNIHTDHWQSVIDALIQSMSNYNYLGRHLDVRSNVKFRGGYFTQWLQKNFGVRVCPIAIEFKKFFMNEWTGEIDMLQLEHLQELLVNAREAVLIKAQEL